MLALCCGLIGWSFLSNRMHGPGDLSAHMFKLALSLEDQFCMSPRPAVRIEVESDQSKIAEET